MKFTVKILGTLATVLALASSAFVMHGCNANANEHQNDCESRVKHLSINDLIKGKSAFDGFTSAKSFCKASHPCDKLEQRICFDNVKNKF